MVTIILIYFELYNSQLSVILMYIQVGKWALHHYRNLHQGALCHQIYLKNKYINSEIAKHEGCCNF